MLHQLARHLVGQVSEEDIGVVLSAAIQVSERWSGRSMLRATLLPLIVDTVLFRDRRICPAFQFVWFAYHKRSIQIELYTSGD